MVSSTYVNYSFLLLVSNAIAFELFVIVVLLIHYEYLSARKMKEKRKHAVVCSFILAALLTPPDVLSQVMMAIPLIILYELSIFYACFRARRSMKRISGLHSPRALNRFCHVHQDRLSMHGPMK